MDIYIYIYIVWSDFRNESSEQLSGLFLDPFIDLHSSSFKCISSANEFVYFEFEWIDSARYRIQTYRVCYRIRVYRLSRPTSRGLETLSRSLIHRIRALELCLPLNSSESIFFWRAKSTDGRNENGIRDFTRSPFPSSIHPRSSPREAVLTIIDTTRR